MHTKPGLSNLPADAERPHLIPTWVNRFLAVVVAAAALTLLWWAARLDNLWGVLAAGILFSYVLLTNYALLHEASHDNLQADRRANYLLGLLTGALFPIPFSLMRSTHRGHHEHNRTDAEMFDLYYPHDNRLIKRLRWYGILLGGFWPLVPLGALLFGLLPAAASDALFRRFRPTGYMLNGISGSVVWLVRLELGLIIGFWWGAFWLLELRWQSTLLLYACFAFNWSTRQYVGHAFSKRDVVEGAWNLKHSRWMSWLLLHGEYDLNHHRHPEVPWLYLPELSAPGDARPSYTRQYWRQWLGPRPATEPEPKPFADDPTTTSA